MRNGRRVSSILASGEYCARWDSGGGETHSFDGRSRIWALSGGLQWQALGGLPKGLSFKDDSGYRVKVELKREQHKRYHDNVA
jgi:hypothetical protein